MCSAFSRRTSIVVEGSSPATAAPLYRIRGRHRAGLALTALTDRLASPLPELEKKPGIEDLAQFTPKT